MAAAPAILTDRADRFRSMRLATLATEKAQNKNLQTKKHMEREETTRQQKVGRQIQKDISDIFLKEARHLVQGAMVTVSKVRVSPDLTFAKIYLSVFPFDKGPAIAAVLKENASMIRYELGKRVKNQLRTVPEIAFAIDDSLEYVDRIEKLIKE